MATCNASTLLSDARANGFDSLPLQFANAVKLQLIKNISGTTSSISTLITDACANGFSCIDGHQAQSVELQLLCDASNGQSPCLTPAAPTDFRVVDELSGMVCFEGEFSGEPGLDFLIHYGTTNGGTYPFLKSLPNDGGVTGCVNGLVNGTTYYFVVQARNTETCVSAFSNQVSGTPHA